MAQLQQESPGRYVMKDLYLFSRKREILARKLETLPIKIPLKPIGILPHGYEFRSAA